MRNSLLTALFYLGLSFYSFAQTPKEGKYQSADGFYYFSLTILEDNSIEIVEPNRTSIYNKVGTNYQSAEAQYSHYMMRIGSPTEIYAYKKGGSDETKYSWIGTDVVSEEDCPLAEKYGDMAADENDPEVQAYSFCAILALAKCSYTSEGFATYAKSMTMVLKQILVDESKCPCSDVIPKEIWNAN